MGKLPDCLDSLWKKSRQQLLFLFDGALKGQKWCHNMKRMLLLQNFAIEIHVVNLCLYFFGQRDNCTWMLVQEMHQIVDAPRQNCHLSSNHTAKQATRNARSEQQANPQLVIPKSHMLFNLSATTLQLSEKWEILSCLLRNIKENRGNCLQFSSHKLIPSEQPKWGLNT